MKHIFLVWIVALCAFGKKPQEPRPSELDLYIQQAQGREAAAWTPSAGGLWSPDARLGDVAADLRARRLDDVLTIVVEERASALSRGSVSSSRSSSANAKVTAAAGPRSTGWLPNLAGVATDRKLDGQGATVRETVLNTVLTARVTHVLPNGNLVIQGEKAVTVNSETQRVIIRGVVRPFDVSTANAIRSDQISMLEVSVAGRGVVDDAIRRPNALYRLLLGILPF